MANYMKKRRSFVAALISFVGSLVLVLGLYLILSAVFTIITTDDSAAGKIILGILVILLCAVIQYTSVMYDKYREHRKWKKRLANTGIEEELSENDALAWQAYRSNPTIFGLKYIEERNPKVGEEIRAYLEETRKGFFGKKSDTDSAVKIRTKEEPEEIVEEIVEEPAEEPIETAEPIEETEENEESVPVISIETEQDWENGETIVR